MKIANVRSQNNFDLIRFLASSLVLFSHSFPLVLNASDEPLSLLSDGQYSGGRVAVIIFFILSGFLIAGSWDIRKNLPNYLYSRILRIFPALAVVLLLSIVLAVLVSVSSVAIVAKSSFLYFVKNLTLYKGQNDIDGVFLDNPYGSVINGSLWTLRHEFTCYLVIGALGYWGLLTKKFVWAAWFASLILSGVGDFSSTFMRDFPILLCWFLAGTLVYLYKQTIPSKGLFFAAVGFF